jgi:hypothetical protein
MLFFLWIVPGIPACIYAVLTGNVVIILIVNVCMSIYTILMQHFLAWRYEDED